MITRENIRELAGFQSNEGCAVSFYYQPSTPKDKSHREEAILVKDLVKNALHEAEKRGRNGCARAGLERILDAAERLHGNNGRAKAIFACTKNNFWREYDLPPRLAGTKVYVNRHFHLRPLTALSHVLPRVSIVLADKMRARFLELWMDEITEREKMSNELSRRGRSDGWAGYEAGHAERHVDNEAMQFFKRVADRMREQQESGFERFLVGCRDDTWPDIERHLHPYVKQRFVGRFLVDPATANPEQVREEAEKLFSEFRKARRRQLVHEVMGQANRNGRGALGLARVLQAMETGEAQMLLIGRTFSAPAAVCDHCQHVDPNVVKTCAVCGKDTREVDDVSDVLLANAVRNGIEIVHVGDDPEFPTTGGVAALLRFRADQNTEVKKAG